MRGEGEILPDAADSGIGEGGSGGAAEKSAVGEPAAAILSHGAAAGVAAVSAAATELGVGFGAM